jgi:hypothetical protein
MIRLMKRRWSYVLLALAGVVGAVLLAVSFAVRSTDLDAVAEGRRDNCLAIERHKAFHREEAEFNLRETRAILRDLGVDPDSARGQNLLKTARRNAARDQARFAPRDC